MEEKPTPAPSANNINDNAEVPNAPAITAPQETPDVWASVATTGSPKDWAAVPIVGCAMPLALSIRALERQKISSRAVCMKTASAVARPPSSEIRAALTHCKSLRNVAAPIVGATIQL
jgi:hypothetical protein